MVADSFLGPLVNMIASNISSNLKGIVFAATFARSPRKLPSSLTYLSEFMPIKSRFLTWLVQLFLMGEWSGSEFTVGFRQAMNLVPVSTIAGQLREVLKVDVVGKLDRLGLPIIYLLATNERLVPSRMSLDFKLTQTTFSRLRDRTFSCRQTLPIPQNTSWTLSPACAEFSYSLQVILSVFC